MRLVSGTTYGADKKIILTFYKALILSKIDYGAQAYNSASKPLLSKLDIIQNHALRIATRAYYSIPINALEVECGIKPLRLRREEIILKYWARSSPLGQALPINNLVTDHGCHTTKRASKFNPYSVTRRFHPFFKRPGCLKERIRYYFFIGPFCPNNMFCSQHIRFIVIFAKSMLLNIYFDFKLLIFCIFICAVW